MPKITGDKDLRVRLEPPLKEAVDRLFTTKKVTQVAAVTAMLQWLLKQDDLLQSVVLGQLNKENRVVVLEHALRQAIAEYKVATKSKAHSKELTWIVDRIVEPTDSRSKELGEKGARRKAG